MSTPYDIDDTGGFVESEDTPYMGGDSYTYKNFIALCKATFAKLFANDSYLDTNKTDVGHSHTESDITDLDKYTQAEVDSIADGKSDTGHTHTSDQITDFTDQITTLKKTLLIGTERTAYDETEATALISDGWLEFNGQTYSETNYPLLAAARPEWVDSGTITVPDLSNRVLRVKGDDTGDAGTEQEDQFQGHYHSLINGANVQRAVNSGGVYPTTGTSWGTYTLSVETPITDGTNGDPRTGTETRAKGFIVRRFVASDAIFS